MAGENVRTEKSDVSRGLVVGVSHAWLWVHGSVVDQWCVTVGGCHKWLLACMEQLMKWIKSNCTADHNNTIDSSSFNANLPVESVTVEIMIMTSGKGT